MRRTLATSLLVLALGARAQSNISTAIDVQHLKPAPGRGGYLGLHGAGVDGHLEWRAGLFASYASAPLVLVVPATGDPVRALVGAQATADLTFAISLLGWLELGLAMPVSYQTSDGVPAPGGELTIASIGAGDARVAPKVRLLDVEGFTLALVGQLSAPTGAADSFLGTGGLTLSPRLVAEYRASVVRLTLNAGADLRGEKQLLNLTVGNALAGGAGVEVELPFGLALHTAVNGAYGLGATSTVSIPVEALAGVRYRLGAIALGAGGGMGLTRGYGTPAWRALATFSYEPAGSARRDELELPMPPPPVAKPRAACSTGPEDFDGFEDDDGCGDPDNDRDGVPDAQDDCRDRPETKNDHLDGDGCPDQLPGGAPAKKNDLDADGVEDDLDLCPELAGTTEDGCPPDDDSDGVVNPLDLCPKQKETFNGFEDEDGCPDEAPDATRRKKGRRR